AALRGRDAGDGARVRIDRPPPNRGRRGKRPRRPTSVDRSRLGPVGVAPKTAAAALSQKRLTPVSASGAAVQLSHRDDLLGPAQAARLLDRVAETTPTGQRKRRGCIQLVAGPL